MIFPFHQDCSYIISHKCFLLLFAVAALHDKRYWRQFHRQFNKLFFFLKVYIGLDFDIIFTSLMVSSLAAITEDFIQESYLIHIVVGISVLNISFDISDDGTSVEEKI